MTKQPTAIRLAEIIEAFDLKDEFLPMLPLELYPELSVELRRLHEVNAKLLEALKDTLYFLERHSNRWDGVNGKHPFTVVEAARAAVYKATGETE